MQWAHHVSFHILKYKLKFPSWQLIRHSRFRNASSNFFSCIYDSFFRRNFVKYFFLLPLTLLSHIENTFHATEVTPREFTHVFSKILRRWLLLFHILCMYFQAAIFNFWCSFNIVMKAGCTSQTRWWHVFPYNWHDWGFTQVHQIAQMKGDELANFTLHSRPARNMPICRE